MTSVRWGNLEFYSEADLALSIVRSDLAIATLLGHLAKRAVADVGVRLENGAVEEVEVIHLQDSCKRSPK